jgi:tetratricopeptide (TPR) repeat protein
MKRLLWGAVFAVAAGVVLWGISKRNHAAVTTETGLAEETPSASAENVVTENLGAPRASNLDTPLAARSQARTASRRAAANPPASEPVFDEKAQIRQSVDALVSPQIGFDEKYRTWIALRDQGKLDLVITELAERATNSPTSAEYPAALGQAYLHKIAVTKDTRDYAVLGALADRSFDAALDIDPANWDARFFKATAMSYWPEEMNKRPEVIQRFTQLIHDQEVQPPQPQFAQSYYWLGETYAKMGRSDYADQVWRRGATLFPSDPMLQQKLTAQK